MTEKYFTEKNDYESYREDITLSLGDYLKNIYDDIKITLKMIGGITEDKFDVYIMEIQNSLDEKRYGRLINKKEIMYKKIDIEEFICSLETEINSYKTSILQNEKLYPNISIKGNPMLCSYTDEDRSILENCLKKELKEFENKKILISDFTIKSRSIFYIILELDQLIYEKYVIQSTMKDKEGTLKKSFLEQIIFNIFEKWREIIYYNISGSYHSLELSSKSIIELASKDIFVTANLPDYSLFTYISSLNYESNSCRGKFAFIKSEDINNIEEFVCFKRKIVLSRTYSRKIRKLLEITQDEYYLIVKERIPNRFEIEGIGKINTELANKIDIIEILGHMEWKLLSKNIEIMKYDGLNMRLPEIEHTVDYYNEQIINFFGIDNVCENLGNVIGEAKKQLHGTIIVISKEAGKEVQRLCDNGRGIEINTINLIDKYNIITKISSIDGAIMIDLDGNCNGIGIILDGERDSKGNDSRGARYNSAKSYVDDKNKKGNICMAFVISEDKTVDVLF